MIGVVIPAHNEATLIGAALLAVMEAAHHPGLKSEPVKVVVVLDACSDATGAIASRSGVCTLSVNARNVGTARGVGAEELLKQGARWLAFTDADSIVAPSWLVDQLAEKADAVCGSISVDDWSAHGAHADALREHFLQTYTDVDGHSHIHGANFGVCALAYRRAGGFRPLACSEDVALVRALEAIGARIAWSAKPRVTTSARRHGRANGGFADALLAAIAANIAQAALAPAV